MNKIGLIISREYSARVRKKSFIIMTLLAPLLFGGVMIIPAWLASRGGDEKIITVIDESGLFKDKLENSNSVKFNYVDKTIEQAKQDFSVSEKYGLLYIPKVTLDEPKGIILYSLGSPSFDIKRSLERKIKKELENVKLTNSGIAQETIIGLKSIVSLQTINLSGAGDESESNSAAASAIGYVSSFLIYMFIFLYGAQIMRGIIEEKTSRIIELMISSVKPFQLMMGKILGIGAVALTQFLLWVILSSAVISGVSSVLKIDKDQNTTEVLTSAENTPNKDVSKMTGFFDALKTINIPFVIGCFIFYFIGGYLMYGSLFAAVGSAVDSDADSQQFMLPITLPLIFSMVMLAAVLNDPHGTLAFWLSIIPFTSPIIMMMRIPFDVPLWELALSMVLVVGGFLATTWFAGRIYRVGIFMHGTKVNYKVLAKWFTMKI